MIKVIKRIVLVLLMAYLAVGFCLYFFQENLIFQSTELEPDYSYRFKSSFEELNLSTSEATLNGLHFKLKKSKGLLLYYHGNAGDLSDWGAVAESFLEMGYEVIIMDYRGYGKSRGEKSQQVLYEDADLYYQYAKKQCAEDKIIVYGRSLGSTFATFVSNKNTPAQLILETPFYSFEDVVQNKFSLYPVNILLRYDFPTYSYLDNIKCPVTLFHGTNDQVVPYKSAEKLYKSMEQTCTMITIQGAGHNNLSSYEQYWDKVTKLLSE